MSIPADFYRRAMDIDSAALNALLMKALCVIPGEHPSPLAELDPRVTPVHITEEFSACNQAMMTHSKWLVRFRVPLTNLMSSCSVLLIYDKNVVHMCASDTDIDFRAVDCKRTDYTYEHFTCIDVGGITGVLSLKVISGDRTPK